MKLTVYSGKVAPCRPLPPAPKRPSIVGKTVLFRISEDGPKLAGMVKSESGGSVDVLLGAPNDDGALIVSANSVMRLSRDRVEIVELKACTDCDVKGWQSSDPVEGAKAATVIREGDKIADYVGVTFEGYGSTFVGTTPSDREGDYVMAGAFNKSLARFKRNPIMLINHQRSVDSVVGHYPKVGVNERGLALQGKVTDEPTDLGRHIRFGIMEGSLRSLSMGGLFFYLEDKKGIREVDLFEVSLVAVPANSDCTLLARSLNADLAEKAFQVHLQRHGGEVRLKNY